VCSKTECDGPAVINIPAVLSHKFVMTAFMGEKTALPAFIKIMNKNI
jgi:hypothetical protein